MRELERPSSDVDFVVEYSGGVREGVFIDALAEQGVTMKGVPLDVHPICTEKRGILADFLLTLDLLQ